MKNIILAATLSVMFAMPAMAGTLTAEEWDLAEKFAVERCTNVTSKYGNVLTLACIENDLQALTEILSYPDEEKDTVNKCIKRSLKYGWLLVQACVDNEIEAKKELDKY